MAKPRLQDRLSDIVRGILRKRYENSSSSVPIKYFVKSMKQEEKRKVWPKILGSEKDKLREYLKTGRMERGFLPISKKKGSGSLPMSKRKK